MIKEFEENLNETKSSPAGCLVLSVRHFQRIARRLGCPLPPFSSLPLTKGLDGISRGFPLQTDTPGANTGKHAGCSECVYVDCPTHSMSCAFTHQTCKHISKQMSDLSRLTATLSKELLSS